MFFCDIFEFFPLSFISGQWISNKYSNLPIKGVGPNKQVMVDILYNFPKRVGPKKWVSRKDLPNLIKEYSGIFSLLHENQQ